MTIACLCLAWLSSAAPRGGNTWFVSPKGSDSNSGAEESPFLSLTKAQAIAKPGDTVRLLPGLYRDGVQLQTSGEPGKPIRFEAAVPGSVTVSGADSISGWTRVEGDEPIFQADWNRAFSIGMKNGQPVRFHPADAPLWGLTQQGFVDGAKLKVTEDLARLRSAWASYVASGRKGWLAPPVPNVGPRFAGAFAVDTSTKKMYVWLADGSDPSNHLMEGAARDQIFGVNRFQNPKGVSYIEVSGITFADGASFAQRAAVNLFGSHNLLENCVIKDMAGTGVSVNGQLRNCLIEGCGHTGGSAIGDGFSNDNDVWRGNSWKPINRGWDAGGVKQTATKNGSFSHCLFKGNGGPGLWLDVWVHNVRVTNCVFEDNEGSGLYVEICHHIQVDHNLARHNAVGAVGNPAGWSEGGIGIAESEDCDVSNNTCIGNKDGLAIREHGPRINNTDTGPMDFHIARDSFVQNLLSQNRDYQLALWYDSGVFGMHPSERKSYSSEEQFQEHFKTTPLTALDPVKESLVFDGNVLQASSTQKASILYGVPWRSRHQELTLTGFTSLTGFPTGQESSTSGGAGWKDAPGDVREWSLRPLPQWMREGVAARS